MEPGAAGATLYSPNPDHVWNRVYAALLVRTNNGVVYDDFLDPPLWYRTKYLLDGESNARAVKALDEFVQDGAVLGKMSPMQRALMQRDLIGVFSWLIEHHVKRGLVPTTNKQRELAAALARAIHYVSLSAEAIRSLPNNYAAAIAAQKLPEAFNPASPDQPFLPSDLLDDNGPWILLEPDGNDADGLTATVHFKNFKGRSAFEVRLRHPDGRAAGESYLRRLAEMPQPLLFEKPALANTDSFRVGEHGPWVNPSTPQFPANTIWALVRRAILADTNGNPVVSPIIESVQVRVYRRIGRFGPSDAPTNAQVFLEWDLNRQLAFNGGGFRKGEPGDNQFPHLMSKGFDPFESGWDYRPKGKPAVMDCATCHGDAGIHSVLSRTRKFEGGYPANFRPGTAHELAEKTEWNSRSMPLWVLLRWMAAGE
jgi:hypothetical protein